MSTTTPPAVTAGDSAVSTTDTTIQALLPALNAGNATIAQLNAIITNCQSELQQIQTALNNNDATLKTATQNAQSTHDINKAALMTRLQKISQVLSQSQSMLNTLQNYQPG